MTKVNRQFQSLLEDSTPGSSSESSSLREALAKEYISSHAVEGLESYVYELAMEFTSGRFQGAENSREFMEALELAYAKLAALLNFAESKLDAV